MPDVGERRGSTHFVELAPKEMTQTKTKIQVIKMRMAKGENFVCHVVIFGGGDVVVEEAPGEVAGGIVVLFAGCCVACCCREGDGVVRGGCEFAGVLVELLIGSGGAGGCLEGNGG